MKEFQSNFRASNIVAALCGAALLFQSVAQPAMAEDVESSAASLEAVRENAVRFLRLTQSSDGTWTTANVPGITALCVTSLLQSGVPADDPAVARALNFLTGLVRDDGGIYHPQTQHRNYETSITVLALSAANSNGKYDKIIRNAEKFLRGLQWDEDEEQKPEDPGYGGAGYGKHQRPDLSNTQFLLEALKTAGVKADDPAMQKALTFVSRCQNLETEHNNTPFAAKIDDGGFYYTPAAGGTSQAGVDANGGLRSYASMTYAGLKSMIYAGVKKDDPRVKAALTWITKHYSLKDNPGMGKQGLYYYYHTFAKTLSVLEIDELKESSGTAHNWRSELVATLAKGQKTNGSWINEADRWYEGDPNLVTAYGLLALSHCEPAKAAK
ncbi:MAG: prenyltransferase/squalene oxidase repeat-containing protein [Planctomycetales bacterium]|jgi:squalene-hopene/tetraprenyl-beta-curcumene cyclase